MEKKKIRNLKGFTLIELLAVIVILAVIALIAVPQVLKILNKTRKSAAEDSTYGIVKSAETYVSNFLLKNNGELPSENLEFECDGTSCNLKTPLTGYNLEGLDKLEFKGTKAKSGIVTIGNSGNNITVTNLNINGFNCNYTGNIASCEKGESETTPSTTGPTEVPPTANGYIGVEKIVYLDPTDLTKYCDAWNINSDNETKTGCMKWYAYADDGTNYTMILDHNTTAAIDNWNDRTSQLTNDTTEWDSSLSPRLITADEIQSLGDLLIYDLDYGWLHDRIGADCRDMCACCVTEATGSNIDYMFGYWTDTPFDSSNAWCVNIFIGGFGYYDVDDMTNGIRPVITVPKNIISQLNI